MDVQHHSFHTDRRAELRKCSWTVDGARSRQRLGRVLMGLGFDGNGQRRKLCFVAVDGQLSAGGRSWRADGRLIVRERTGFQLAEFVHLKW